LWNQLEPIIEQYNQVHSQLVDNQNKVADLQKRLLPLQLPSPRRDLRRQRLDGARSDHGRLRADGADRGPPDRGLPQTRLI